MNPESPNDSLDSALSARRAMTPPDAFTGAVLARVNAEPRRLMNADLFAEYGVRAGLALAAFGVSLVVDLNRLGAGFGAAVGTPEGATVVSVLAVCLTWVLTQEEPEGAAR